MTYGYRSISASAPTLANPGTTLEQLDRALSKVHKGIALCLTTTMTWPNVGCSCFREGRQRDWQRKCMAQVELQCRDQYRCGEQRAAWRCAVVCRLDHAAHGKRLGPCMAGEQKRGDFSPCQNHPKVLPKVSECHRRHKNHDMRQSKGSKKSKSKGRNNREFKCHECGKFCLGVRSREASVFETSKRSLAETRCVDMVNVDLSALEIGAVLLLTRNHKIQVGIDSCVTVFAKSWWRCQRATGVTICFSHITTKVP